MDVFSFGVLLVLEMCSAQFPEVADQENLISSIQHPCMVALIRRCLAHVTGIQDPLLTILLSQN